MGEEGQGDGSGQASASAQVVGDRQLQMVTDALTYLEERGVRRVLQGLTEALLVDRPADPAAFLIDALQRGWDTWLCQPAAKPAEAVAPAAPAACGHDASDAGRAASVFLKMSCPAPRDAVRQLLGTASEACGCEVEFYSAPGGCGRSVATRGESEEQRSSFVLAASSSLCAVLGGLAQGGHLATLQLAMEHGVAAVGQLAAATVRTEAGLEGILLAMAPKSNDLRYPAPVLDSSGRTIAVGPAAACGLARAAAMYGGVALAPSLNLWSLVLAERLERLRWRAESQAAAQAFDKTLKALELLNTHSQSAGASGAVASIVSQQLLRGGVTLDRVALWAHSRDSNELVLCSGGQPEGTRSMADMATVEEAAAAAGRHSQIVCVQDLSGSECGGPRSTLCVPIGHIEDDQLDGAGSAAVIQFTGFRRRGDAGQEGVGSDSGGRIDHFDLAAASALQNSVLPVVFQVRSVLRQLFQGDRTREGLRVVLSHLTDVSNVTEVVKLAEEDLPAVLECEQCTLFFVDVESGEIWAPPRASLPNGIRIGIGEGLAGHVAQTALESAEKRGGVVVSNDLKTCQHWKGDVDSAFVTRNLMTAPVWSGSKDSRLLALIQILNKREVGPGEAATATGVGTDGEPDGVVGFTQEDAQLLEVLAKALGNHLQRLLLDMMLTKARMDTQEAEGGPSMVGEYYDSTRGHNNKVVIGSLLHSPTMLFASHRPNTADTSQTVERVFHLEVEPPPHADVRNWHIEYWDLKEPEEFMLVVGALRHTGALAAVPVPPIVLFNFFSGVKSTYNSDNPYHNFQHAISTLHFSYMLTTSAGLLEHLEAGDMFSLIIAALGHDCGHRGRNNAFEVMTRSDLALRYNDSSPLENHHCAVMFDVALNSTKDCNIFQELGPEVFGSIRRLIIAGILSTDMKHHGSHVQLLAEFKLQPGTSVTQTQFLVELLLHAADISNPLMPPDIAARWGRAVADEFGQQALNEEQLGIPVTAFMAGLQDPKAAAKSQLGFIDFVIQPLATSMFRLFPGLTETKTFLEDNREAASKIVEAQVRTSTGSKGSISVPRTRAVP